MQERVERGVTIDRCGSCSALFFDAGELAAWRGHPALGDSLVEATANPNPNAAPGPACARCGQDTCAIRFTRAEADVCTACHGVMLLRTPVDAPRVAPASGHRSRGGLAAEVLAEGSIETVGAVADAGALGLMHSSGGRDVPDVGGFDGVDVGAVEVGGFDGVGNIDVGGADLGGLDAGGLDGVGDALEGGASLLGSLFEALGDLLGSLDFS